ncbi:hypothetical protein DFH28DRAFT_942078 [Melampsora americana]|nr:hypothetical protein DFH28DRAFT_942078 [Melampsora americana]
MSDITLCETSRSNTNDETMNTRYLIPDSKERIWQQLCQSLGWYWPPRNLKTDETYARSRVLVHFGRLNSLTQTEILDFNQRSNGRDYDPNRIDRYWITWHIRAVMLEAIEWAVNGYCPDPDLLIFRDFTGNSELTWLDLNRFRPKRLADKQLDFPVGILFFATDPLQAPGPSHPCNPKAQSLKIQLDKSPSQGFWSIGFQTTPYPIHDINFSHSKAFPLVRVPHHIGKIGEIWVEHGKAGSKNRILFRKTVTEDDLSILIWPQYQSAHLDEKCTLVPLPRIPAYADEIIELCNEDRILLFASHYSSHRIHITLQITVRFEWASETSADSSIWVPNQFNWPNPTTRYSHYVRRPITMPLEKSSKLLEQENSNSKKIHSKFLRIRIKTPILELKEIDSNTEYDLSPTKELSSSKLKRSIDQVNKSERKQLEIVEKSVSPRPKVRLPSSIESVKVETDPNQRPSRRQRVNSVSVHRRTSLPRASKSRNIET